MEKFDELQDPVVTSCEATGLSPWQLAEEEREVREAVAKLQAHGITVREACERSIIRFYLSVPGHGETRGYCGCDLLNLVDELMRG